MKWRRILALFDETTAKNTIVVERYKIESVMEWVVMGLHMSLMIYK